MNFPYKFLRSLPVQLFVLKALQGLYEVSADLKSSRFLITLVVLLIVSLESAQKKGLKLILNLNSAPGLLLGLNHRQVAAVQNREGLNTDVHEAVLISVLVGKTRHRVYGGVRYHCELVLFEFYCSL